MHDRLGPVADLGRVRTSAHDLGADRRWILAARIVVGHDDGVGAVRRRRAHQPALARIAVAARADDGDDISHRVRTQRPERRGDRVGGVRVVDEDGRPVAAPRNELHPPAHRAHRFERGEDRLGLLPRADRQRRGEQDVRGLKVADEFKLGKHRAAAPREAHRLPGLRAAARQDSQIGALAPAHRDRPAATRRRRRGHGGAFGIVDVDDGGAARRQHAGEQPLLGGAVGIDVRMVVEMIAGEVGEGGGSEPHTVEPALLEAVARRLHGDALGPRRGGVAENPVQRQRVGGGEGGGLLERALDAGGADADRLVSERVPDLAREACDRSLSVGPGHRDGGLRLPVEPRRGGERVGAPGILDDDDLGCLRRQPRRLDEGGARGVGQDRSGAALQRPRRVLRAMRVRPRQGGEEKPAAHGGAVMREAAHRRIPAGSGESQLREGFGPVRHVPSPPAPSPPWPRRRRIRIPAAAPAAARPD